MDTVTIFDTTLRDGEQSPGASMNTEEKLRVARALERLGADVIEAGFPISSPGDFEAVKLIADQVRGLQVAGLARANVGDIDRAWEALKGGENPRIHTFIATSPIHMEHKLRLSADQVLEQAVAAVKHACQFTSNVEFSAEDAARSDLEFLCRVVEAVIDAGAATVNIPDTVGYAIPSEFGAMIRSILERVPKSPGHTEHGYNNWWIYIANVDEDDPTGQGPLAMQVRERAEAEGMLCVPVCAKIEAELSELDDADRLEMLESIGLHEPALDAVARACFALLDMHSYFTAGPKEIRAWPIPVGATAPQAAGVIHTDFERGFIRAEVYSVNDLVEYKTEKAIREAGKLRVEGKSYVMQDGDVTHFLFNT